MKEDQVVKDILIIKSDIREIKKDIDIIKNAITSSSDNSSDTIDDLKVKSKDLEKLQDTFKNAKQNLTAIADMLKRPM